MQTASAQVASLMESGTIGLASLSPSLRESLKSSLKKDCCPDMKDSDVEKVFRNILGATTFDVKSHGIPDDGYVTFESVIPGHKKLFVTSRMRLQQYIRA